MSKEKIVHNSVDITHSDHNRIKKILDILEGKEGDEYGHVDVYKTPFEEHIPNQALVIEQQVSSCFVKEDWFFILEMQNMTLFSSSNFLTHFTEVFHTCLTAYNDGNKNLFNEHKDSLVSIYYRDCWKEYKCYDIQDGIRIVFKRKCMDIALPPFASYNMLMRHGFKIRATYWCRDSDDNSGFWENGEHIHMDSDLMGSFELQLF